MPIPPLLEKGTIQSCNINLKLISEYPQMNLCMNLLMQVTAEVLSSVLLGELRAYVTCWWHKLVRVSALLVILVPFPHF